LIKIAVPGVNGRMGQEIAQAVLQTQGVELVLATVRAGNEQAGKKVANSDVTIETVISKPSFDVLIDFTLPEGVMEHLAYCREHKKPMVIGTTAFTPEQQAAIKAAAQEIPIVQAPNMSIGVNVCFKLIAQAAKMLPDYDLSVIDVHHQHKKDSPSGTAKNMAQILADSSGQNLEAIEILSHRAGDIVGTHIVTFKNPHEFITIGHEAQDRGIFAQGAVLAAKWVGKQKPGLYSMQDVIS